MSQLGQTFSSENWKPRQKDSLRFFPDKAHVNGDGQGQADGEVNVDGQMQKERREEVVKRTRE